MSKSTEQFLDYALAVVIGVSLAAVFVFNF